MAIGKVTFSNLALSVIKLRFSLHLRLLVLFLSCFTSQSGEEISRNLFHDHPPNPIRICIDTLWQLKFRASPISSPDLGYA